MNDLSEKSKSALEPKDIKRIDIALQCRKTKTLIDEAVDNGNIEYAISIARSNPFMTNDLRVKMAEAALISE